MFALKMYSNALCTKKQPPSYKTAAAKSYSELIRPISKLLTGGVHAEHLASFDHGAGAAGFQLLVCFAHTAAAGRSKRNDRLAG